MKVPGSNILNAALSLISSQTITYYRNTGRTTNKIMSKVATFADPVYIEGSVQPVRRSVYQMNGLDFSKKYVTLFTSQNILDLDKDVSGDQFAYNGRLYQVESKDDWIPEDGWNAILAVDIGTAPAIAMVWGFNSDAQTFDNGNFGDAG